MSTTDNTNSLLKAVLSGVASAACVVFVPLLPYGGARFSAFVVWLLLVGFLKLVVRLNAVWILATALFVIALPASLFFIGSFALTPLMIASFSLGWRYGVVAALASILVITTVSGPILSLAFLILSLLPFLGVSWLFLRQNNTGEWFYPVGSIISITVAVTLVFLELMIAVIPTNIMELQAAVANFQGALSKSLNLSESEFLLIVNGMSPWVPAIFGLSILITVALNFFLVQKIGQRLSINLRCLQQPNLSRPSLPQLNWHIPKNWDISFVLGLMLLCLGRNYHNAQLLIMAKTAVVLSGVPLAIVGLRICYLWLLPLRSGVVWFRLLCAVSFLLVWPFIFIVLLGFVEPWYDLTSRMLNGNNNKL